MDPRCFLAIIGVLRDNALAVAVDVEVDSASRNNSNKVGAKTLEESARAFGFVDVADNLEGVIEMVKGRSGRVKSTKDLYLGLSCSSNLGLVKIGLESGLENI